MAKESNMGKKGVGMVKGNSGLVDDKRQYKIFLAIFSVGMLLWIFWQVSSLAFGAQVGASADASSKVTGGVVGVAGSGNTGSGGAVKAVVSDDVVRIPLSEISDKVKFYSFNSNGVEIKYFVVKGSDGKVRTAFNACEVCGGSRGYRQEGGDVVCNKCGRRFKIDDLGKANLGGGGCMPGYLPHTIDSEDIVIKKKDLETGKRFY